MNTNTTQILQGIAAELGRDDIAQLYLQHTTLPAGTPLRLFVAGQANAGKSTLINHLTGATLPTESLPSGKNHDVADSEWLKAHKCAIAERHPDIAPDELDDVHIGRVFATCDACIYVMNAQSALNRTDMAVLRTLSNAAVETLVVMGRFDLVSEDDRREVLDYVTSNLKALPCVSVAPYTQPFIDGTAVQGQLLPLVEDLLKRANVEQTRANFRRFFLVEAVSGLFEECQKRIDEANSQLASLDALKQEKEERLGNQLTQWLKLETELRQRMADLSSKVRDELQAQRTDMLRRLSHDVDVCGDVKLFWEKDFPFRMEEMLRAQAQGMAQHLDAQLSQTLHWLQDTLMRSFHCRMTLTTTQGWGGNATTAPDTSGINITDTNRVRMVTRVGTAVTVVAAGAMLATSGIAGIVMAVGMMSGLGAEVFMRNKTNQAREQIKQHLPAIIERSIMQYAAQVEQHISTLTDSLTAQLHDVKKEWHDQQLTAIAQETAIARFNAAPTRWEAVMGRINQLAALVID